MLLSDCQFHMDYFTVVALQEQHPTGVVFLTVIYVVDLLYTP